MSNVVYVYFFKRDESQEVIGNVLANNLDAAREKIAIIKQLPIVEIDRLFVIKQKRRNNAIDIQ